MKKTIPFLFLATLVACSGDSGGSKKSSEISKYVDALNSAQVGQVKNTTEKGTDYDITQDVDNNVVVKIKTLASTKKVILLKIDGDKTYSYEEETQADGRVFKSVSIARNDFQKQIEEVLKIPGSKIENDILYFVTESELSQEISSATLHVAYRTKGQANLSKPNCEEYIETKTFNSTLRNQNGLTVLPDTHKIEDSKCGEILPKSQLKKLDLRSVEVCEESENEEVQTCSGPTDMSFLISEL